MPSWPIFLDMLLQIKKVPAWNVWRRSNVMVDTRWEKVCTWWNWNRTKTKQICRNPRFLLNQHAVSSQQCNHNGDTEVRLVSQSDTICSTKPQQSANLWSFILLLWLSSPRPHICHKWSACGEDCYWLILIDSNWFWLILIDSDCFSQGLLKVKLQRRMRIQGEI